MDMRNVLAYTLVLLCVLASIRFFRHVAPPKPTGFPVQLGVDCSKGEYHGWELLVRYVPDGKYWIQDYPFNEASLRAKLKEILKEDRVKLVWIGADERLSYGNVVDLMNKLQKDTPGLRIALATRQQIGPVDPAQIEALNAAHHTNYLRPIPPCLPASAWR